MSFKFDPCDFIREPYKVCPKCGENTFGVLSINKFSYSRRCKKCFYPNPRNCDKSESFSLPETKKKIIYLDQFVNSNILKALDPCLQKQGKVDPYWMSLFERLDVLSKKQLIVCPDSTVHEEESLPTNYFLGLKRVYEQLSHGISFKHPLEIEKNQIYTHFIAWKNSTPIDQIIHNPETVIYGVLHSWNDTFIITTNRQYDTSWVTQIENERDKIHILLNSVTETWKTEKGLSEEDFYLREINETKKNIFLNFLNDMKKPLEQRYKEAMSFSFPSNEYLLVQNLLEILFKDGLNFEDALKALNDFFESNYFKTAPHTNLSCRLFAKIAYKYSTGGLVKAPNKGMWNDIKLISNYSKYCDAIFIDRHMSSLLKESPLKELFENQKIFSLETKDQFLEYLNTIEKNMPKGFEATLNDVYGENSFKPYTSIFDEYGTSS